MVPGKAGRYLATFEPNKHDLMSKARGAMSARTVDAIVEGIQEVKGKDIVVLDLREVPNTVCDQFIICHGESATQVEAITRSVLETLRERTGEKPRHVEGERNAEWVLIDLVDTVVHIFHRDKRAHYALEDLWGDATRRVYENVA